MGILDWFINRPAQFDPDRLSSELAARAMDKAIALTNPRLKLLDDCQERLLPAVEKSIHYLRTILREVPAAMPLSSTLWAADPNLRAFFAAGADISRVAGRSSNLRTLFEKYPSLDDAHLVLGMSYAEQQVFGMSLRGDIVQRDVSQTVVSFSDHQARICGHSDAEVRRLVGTQSFEYLVAQALAQIGTERSERQELTENRALIRARLRLFRQHGPGLGSVFGAAPEGATERVALEAQLLENERQLEALGSPRDALEKELESLLEVLGNPEDYLTIESKTLRLSPLNVLLEKEDNGAAADVSFSLVTLKGIPEVRRAFVLAYFSRYELPSTRVDLGEAERYL